MASIRRLNHNAVRRLLRHTTRMLDGARRPPEPNYLAIACRALNEAMKIDERLRPFMAEQREMLERWLHDQEIKAALRKVYGQASVDDFPAPPVPVLNARKAEASLLKEELALAKSRLVLAQLQAKLENQ